LKASEKYREVLGTLETERRAHVILYLFSDEVVGETLEWTFRNARKEIVLARQEEFVRSPLSGRVTSRYLTTTLADTLRRISDQQPATAGR